jgi:hypothetical protein
MAGGANISGGANRVPLRFRLAEPLYFRPQQRFDVRVFERFWVRPPHRSGFRIVFPDRYYAVYAERAALQAPFQIGSFALGYGVFLALADE